ncbi:MAG: AfsR/SARP family transcriptional regulator, partial [Trebonia sp.]
PSLCVLALALICAEGQLVPVARLGELLAEPGAEPTEPTTVRSHVSHLRKALRDNQARGEGAKVLISGRCGETVAYALRPEAIDTDAARFDRRVDAGLLELHEGNYDTAARILRSALSLWRGDPLADASGRAFARDRIVHLQSRYRNALIARIATDVVLRHADATAELECLVRRWPDEERLRILLAVALHRTGRPVGAAAACRAAIGAAYSQGLDSPRLHRLQQEVLTGTLSETGLPHLPPIS